ncbi:hypothetical protein T439DRAFT_98029 [Meredithblackwellia eburnea MCA 4105]
MPQRRVSSMERDGSGKSDGQRSPTIPFPSGSTSTSTSPSSSRISLGLINGNGKGNGKNRTLLLPDQPVSPRLSSDSTSGLSVPPSPTLAVPILEPLLPTSSSTSSAPTKKSSLFKRRSFSLWRRTDTSNSITAPPSPALEGEHDLSTAASTTSASASNQSSSFESSRNSDSPGFVQGDGEVTAPSLPSLQLSSSPYRMSWGFGSASGNSSPSSSNSPVNLNHTQYRRPHSSSGPPGGAGSWNGRPTSLLLVGSPAGEQIQDNVGLGFQMENGGSAGAGPVSSSERSPRRRSASALTRLVRSNSDAAHRLETNPSTSSLFQSSSTSTRPGSSSGPSLPVPGQITFTSSPLSSPKASAVTLLPNSQGRLTSSPHSSRPPSPVKRNASSSSLLFSNSQTLDRPSFSGSKSKSRSGSNAGGGPTGVFSAVTGFFSGSVTSLTGSNSNSNNMSRSSSSNSMAGHGGEGSAGIPSEFGALFDSKGSSKSSPRKRGLSVGNGIFSTSPSRKRAGSSSSLSNSWVPPPLPSAGGNSNMTLAVPDMTSGGGSGSTSSNSPTTATAATTQFGRSRASTDPRRFSFSSQASMPSPPVSPTITRRSSFAAQSRSGGDSPVLPLTVPAVSGRARAASVKVAPGESSEAYVHRLMVEVGKGEVARLLSTHGSAFHITALGIYLSSFDFARDPLDIALRKFLMEASLPAETQQIDRVMEAFAVRYNDCNPGLFTDSDTPYVLAFSLVMLSTDHFNPRNKNKMTKADYIKNTKVGGVSTEVLEYFYDQITITPFVFVEEDGDVSSSSRPELANSTSSSFFKSSTTQKERAKVDPYNLITQDQTQELRVDVEAIIPAKSPFSFTGTTSFFNATTLHQAFARAPILQVTSRPRSKSSASSTQPPPASIPLAPTSSISTFAPPIEKGSVSSLKITKIGLLSRKEDLVEGGKKSSSRKWKGWSVILTGSQLLFFKDPGVAGSLQHSIEAAAQSVDPPPDENSVLVFTTTVAFKPDAVLSLASSAAIYDSTYSKYQHVFRLVAPAGRQYLFQARDSDDLNSWLAHINYAASFKTASIRMRGLTKKPSTPVPPNPTPLSPSWRGHSNGSTLSNGPPTPGLPEQAVPDLATPGLPSVSEEDPTLPASLREALRTATVDATPLGRPSSEFPFPQTAHLPDIPVSPTSPPITESERLPDTRVELLRSKIYELEEEIKFAKEGLHEDLRLARNLAVLTPFVKSTRDRITAALLPIERRVRYSRLNLAKLVCHREVLSRDLLVEDREQRTRKIFRGRVSSGHLGSSTSSVPWSLGQSSIPLTAASRISESDNLRPASFDSDPYAGALTDDELDRALRSPPMMQRSRTELDASRLRSGSVGASEDELPSREIGRQAVSPGASTTSLPSMVNRKSQSHPSAGVGTLAEISSLTEPLPPRRSASSQSIEQVREAEVAEDWRSTKAGHLRRLSLVDYESLLLATLKENTVEGSVSSS